MTQAVLGHPQQGYLKKLNGVNSVIKVMIDQVGPVVGHYAEIIVILLLGRVKIIVVGKQADGNHREKGKHHDQPANLCAYFNIPKHGCRLRFRQLIFSSKT